MVAEGFRFEGVRLRAPDGTVILEDVSCRFPLGAVTVVCGPSGAGKSTVLRLCNRLEVPTTGRILLDGDDLASLDPLALRRRVGMVFQRPVVFGGSVRDNLHVADPAATDDALAAALDGVGLDAALLDRRADDLSGGEAQRLCLARTLLTHPEVVLMDEPTSALDPDNRDRVEALARGLASRGIGIVWVSHDDAQAGRLADSVCRVEGGTVVAPADPGAAPSTDGGGQP